MAEESSLRVVQVDDAGIGSPVGGASIGAYDALTGAFQYDLIDVSYFQDGNFRPKEYLKRTVNIIDDLFSEMGIVPESHRVEICSGHIFDDARIWLGEQGYDWKPVKIEDPLQSLIENSFSDYLISVGVPEKIRVIEVGRDQFMYLFNWVKDAPEERVRYCKTNGSKWKTKWSHRLREKPRVRA